MHSTMHTDDDPLSHGDFFLAFLWLGRILPVTNGLPVQIWSHLDVTRPGSILNTRPECGFSKCIREHESPSRNGIPNHPDPGSTGPKAAPNTDSRYLRTYSVPGFYLND